MFSCLLVPIVSMGTQTTDILRYKNSNEVAVLHPTEDAMDS